MATDFDIYEYRAALLEWRQENVGQAQLIFVANDSFDNQAAQMAPSSGTTWSDPDMPRQFETKSGAVATFTWTGN